MSTFMSPRKLPQIPMRVSTMALGVRYKREEWDHSKVKWPTSDPKVKVHEETRCGPDGVERVGTVTQFSSLGPDGKQHWHAPLWREIKGVGFREIDEPIQFVGPDGKAHMLEPRWIEVKGFHPIASFGSIKKIDAWEMRDRLLAANDIDAVHQFLEDYGPFGQMFPVVDKEGPEYISLSDFQCIQQMFRDALLRKPLSAYPDSWTAPSNTVTLSLEPDSDGAYVADVTTEPLDALWATVQLDFAWESQFRVCARPDCGRIFRITHSARIYCDNQTCAHLMAVRNYRKRKSAAKKRGNKMRRQP
jgi:hypothetical protein